MTASSDTPPPQTPQRVAASSSGLVLPFGGVTPTLGPDVFLAPGSVVIGDVVIGASSSVWFNTVIRGDVHHIRIGDRVNVQDLTMIHVTTDTHATILEDDVTVGHRVVLHGCTVRRGALIGMGAIVMDAAEIGEGALVGAGSVVTPGTHIPPGMLALGAPARPVRPLKPHEIDGQRTLAAHYCATALAYMSAGCGGTSTDA